MLAFSSGYRQVTSHTTSTEQFTPISVNFPTACSRVLNIGGIRWKENKSLKAQYILKSIRTETLDEYKRYDNLYSWFQLGRWFWDHPFHSVSFSIFISVSYLFCLKGLTFRELMGRESACRPSSILHDAKIRKNIHTKKYFKRKM